MGIRILNSFEAKEELKKLNLDNLGENGKLIQKELINFIELNDGTITEEVVDKSIYFAKMLEDIEDKEEVENTAYFFETCDFLAVESNIVTKEGFKKLKAPKEPKFDSTGKIFDRTCNIISIEQLGTDALDELTLRINR